MDEELNLELPENANQPLKEGETYEPILKPTKQYPEVSAYSVCMGLLMAVIFSAAAAYLGLKVGQVFEAAIPIAIIAVGLSGAMKRKNALGENVIIQSIGACSGVIVAGAIFTLPALYILHLDVNFVQIFLSSLLGGVLGILFLIPFRKYFVQEMHGKYPFPEATATTQVLISGAQGGSQAKPLLIAGLVGGLYDFVVATFGAWAEAWTTRVLPFGTAVAEKAKLVFGINTGAAVLGLGYIIGLKYAAIICAGSALVWFVLVPLMPVLGNDFLQLLNPTVDMAANAIDGQSAEWIFKNFARHIGIGGIAMAGLIGIVKQWGIIKSAIGLAAKELKGGKGGSAEELRTQRDLSMKVIAIGVIIALVATFVFFWCGVVDFNLLHAVVGILIVAVIAFLFTTVAANAIAIVGSNPVSGMTLMTLILASVIMVAVGLKGNAGMLAALVIGGVVCTALSTAGGFITDLKIGYWIGTTPKKQEAWKFLGVLVSAATVGGVMIILNKTYGFGEGGLVAPQANAMAAVIEPLMSGSGAPWWLYATGALLALVLNFCGVPALAFSLGMFIPMSLNAPLLVGGFLAWLMGRGEDKELAKRRTEKGTLIASGFIAGGALMGVVSAALKFAGVDFYLTGWAESAGAQHLSFVAYVLLCVYFYFASKRVK